MGCQILQENAVWDSNKVFAEVRVRNLSINHQPGHLVVRWDQVGQTGPAFLKPLLAGPVPLIVLYVLYDHTQENLLPNLPRC